MMSYAQYRDRVMIGIVIGLSLWLGYRQKEYQALPKPVYKSRVSVSDGFHRGRTGTVVSEDTQPFGRTQYMVDMDDGSGFEYFDQNELDILPDELPDDEPEK